MSTKLIPLKSIPYSGRAVERAARKAAGGYWPALEAAQYKIVVAPGCHGRPYFDPPVVGWVCTEEAARAISQQVTRMPNGTAHRRLAYQS